MKLHDLKTQHTAALDKAESFVTVAEAAGRNTLTPAESENMTAALAEANNLGVQIKAIEDLGTLRSQARNGMILPGVANANPDADSEGPRQLSAEYVKDFSAWAKSRGKSIGANMSIGQDSEGGFVFPTRSRRANAAAYEGAGGSGSFILPMTVEQQIVPLAPPEMGVESIATVIPTSVSLQFPIQTGRGTAASKAESTTATATSFGGTDPTLNQFTLGAFMIGHAEDASWELLQDVSVFQSFMTQDILLSLAILKENNYVSGSGTGQPQGLIGNTGAGITGVTAASEGETTLNNAILDATLDVQGILNAVYHQNAGYLMARATSIALRKAQKQANLFEPCFVRSGGVDYLHGYPVTYSTSMPAAAAGGNTPILFGDFKAGYIIGLRGGTGVNVKILDQPKAMQGLLTVLGYQRVDGRVRRSEAIQAITLT
jgi:HK97 family phage major capsid protein